MLPESICHLSAHVSIAAFIFVLISIDADACIGSQSGYLPYEIGMRLSVGDVYKIAVSCTLDKSSRTGPITSHTGPTISHTGPIIIIGRELNQLDVARMVSIWLLTIWTVTIVEGGDDKITEVPVEVEVPDDAPQGFKEILEQITNERPDLSNPGKVNEIHVPGSVSVTQLLAYCHDHGYFTHPVYKHVCRAVQYAADNTSVQGTKRPPPPSPGPSAGASRSRSGKKYRLLIDIHD